ncbi:MAG: phosphodiesterase [Paracoccaceae bacterium]
MLIAQISDTHIASRTEKTCGVAPMADNLRRCVQSINALHTKPDLVLHSGDVTHSGTSEETCEALRILSDLEAPLFVVPGNHDDRAVLAGVFGPGKCPTTEESFVDYVVEEFPIRIIALDSLHLGHPGGQLGEARLDWLHERLSEDIHRPTIVFTHHPPLRLGVPETDEDGFEGAERFGKIVSQYANIERLLCGHIHLHTNTRWRGTVVTTAPSPGMQLALEWKQSEASQFLLSAPQYLLHHWTKDRVLITHPIILSDLPGPYEFT